MTRIGSDEDEVGTLGWGLCLPPTGLFPNPTFPPLLWSPCMRATFHSLGTSINLTICLIHFMLRPIEKLQKEYLGLPHTKIVHILLYMRYHFLCVRVFLYAYHIF